VTTNAVHIISVGPVYGSRDSFLTAVVLCGVLSGTVFSHYLLMSVTVTLLISPQFWVTYSDYAQSLINKPVTYMMQTSLYTT